MELVDHFRTMARNNAWSNDRLFRAVLSLRPGEYGAPRTSFFPSIRETLDHLLSVDLYYLDALEEGGVGLAVFERFQPLEEGSAWARAQAAADRRLIAFCDRLFAADLTREVATDRREEGFVLERVGDILAHLFVHDIHHRGQVHAMLAGTSVKPPQLDEFLLRLDAARRAEEVARLGLGGP